MQYKYLDEKKDTLEQSQIDRDEKREEPVFAKMAREGQEKFIEKHQEDVVPMDSWETARKYNL